MAKASSTRICSGCRIEKPHTPEFFYRNRAEPSGLGHYCKPCWNAKIKKRPAMTDGRHTQYCLNWRKREMQDPTKRARRLQIGREHMVRYNRANEEQHQKKLVRNRAHYHANKEKYNGYVSKRRARKAGNGGSHTAEEWGELCALFGNACLACGKVGKVGRDHVIPLLKGGSDDITNIQPLCRRCNNRKFVASTDHRTLAKVALPELNAVGQLLFPTCKV